MMTLNTGATIGPSSHSRNLNSSEARGDAQAWLYARAACLSQKGRRASQQGVVALLAHAIEQRAVCPRAKMQEIGGAFVGAIDRDRAEVGEIGCPATKAWCVLQGIVMSAYSVPGNAHILVRALYA